MYCFEDVLKIKVTFCYHCAPILNVRCFSQLYRFLLHSFFIRTLCEVLTAELSISENLFCLF